jgi:hypothetical protein
VFFLVAGYAPIYFEYVADPYFYVAGRGTRYSSFATFGCAILTSMVLFAIKNSFIKKISIYLFVAILSAYSFFIQEDYSRTWEFTKSIVNQAIEGSPDFSFETPIVIVIPSTYFVPTVKQFRTGSIGSEPFGYQTILYAANHDTYLSRFLLLDKDWPLQLKKIREGQVFWDPIKTTPYILVLMSVPKTWSSESFIVFDLDSETSNLKRRFEPIYVEGIQITKTSLKSDQKPYHTWRAVFENNVEAAVNRTISIYIYIQRGGSVYEKISFIHP